MARTIVKIIGVTATVGLVAIVTAAGRHLLPQGTPPPVVQEMTDSAPLPTENYDVVMLGWRNLTLSAGTVAANTSTSTIGWEDALTIRTDAVHPVIEGRGEAGFRVVWRGASPPPSTPIPFLVNHAMSFTGTKGFVTLTPPVVFDRIEMADFERDGSGGMGLKDENAQVTLTQGPDGKYTGELWVLSPEIKVESGPGDEHPTVTYGIVAVPSETSPAPQTEARR